MIKWVIPALLVIVASAYISSVVFSSPNDPLSCAGCHEAEYKSYLFPANNPDMSAHKEKSISCIECHSSPGIQSKISARRLIINAQLVSYSLPVINGMLNSNFSFNRSFNTSDFSILKADCDKCHDANKTVSLKLTHTNYSNYSNCEKCHTMHNIENKTSLKPDSSFSKPMGKGGHRNITCGDCHGTDPTRLEELPQCTKCHMPHLKGAQWDRSICLGCHNDPHFPVRTATFKGTLTKEMCAACHEDIYSTLTTNNSEHNQNVPACINCHPKHGVAIRCNNCHIPHGYYRKAGIHVGSKCSSCHIYVKKCTGCHTDPHNPRSDLPEITQADEWKNFAQEINNRTKR